MRTYKKTKPEKIKTEADLILEEMEEEKDEDESEKYETGWEDVVVQKFLQLISQNATDKSNQDQINQTINNTLKEASIVQPATKPRYIGTKRLKQAKSKTVARIQPLKWNMQGDGASEEEEILVTKAFQEALHRCGYDSTFTGKGGVIDGMITYGNKYRLIQYQDSKNSSFPIIFKCIDNNNAWMSTKATSFRNGNKNVTQFGLVFTGTVREFKDACPEYADAEICAGEIPKNYVWKDLDQTSTQQFNGSSGLGKDSEKMDWGYFWDIAEREYIFVAGSQLQILEKKTGKNYPWVFKDLEEREQAYFPVSNFICIPSEEGIYDVSLMAYLYDYSDAFRMALNGQVDHTLTNVNPHIYVNIPQGQEAAFFNLVEMADQMSAAGRRGYVPLTFNPNGSTGQISNAQPLLNGGDQEAADRLMNRIDDEFRKCGVYLDEPLDSNLTEQQIALQASNASTLPKEIMKYNAPEIEFELMVAKDLFVKYIKTGDKTPLILDTTIDLPDGKYSIRGIPYTLGWLKEKLMQRAWRFQVDKESGAVTNNNQLISLYKSILPSMDPASPAYAAMNDKIALLSGITIPKINPASQAIAAQDASMGGKPVPVEDAGAPPELKTPAPLLQKAAGLPQ